MKFKTSMKAMNESYFVVRFGYCEIQALLHGQEPIAYSSGVYGWNCDYYRTTFPWVVISTGYRPTGTRLFSFNEADFYENQAKEIIYDYSIQYDERMKKLEKLLSHFYSDLREKESEFLASKK